MYMYWKECDFKDTLDLVLVSKKERRCLGWNHGLGIMLFNILPERLFWRQFLGLTYEGVNTCRDDDKQKSPKEKMKNEHA